MIDNELFCRNYAVRRIRDSFKENKSLSDQNQIKQQINKGYDNLEIIKRQVIKLSKYLFLFFY